MCFQSVDARGLLGARSSDSSSLQSGGDARDTWGEMRGSRGSGLDVHNVPRTMVQAQVQGNCSIVVKPRGMSPTTNGQMGNKRTDGQQTNSYPDPCVRDAESWASSPGSEWKIQTADD